MFWPDWLLNQSISLALSFIRPASIWKRKKQFNPPEVPDTLDDRIYIETVLHACYETLRVCAILMQPAVPSIAYKILNRLGIPLESRYLDDAKLGFQNDTNESSLWTNRDRSHCRGQIWHIDAVLLHFHLCQIRFLLGTLKSKVRIRFLVWMKSSLSDLEGDLDQIKV